MKTKESKAATYLCIGIVLSFALTIFKTLILDRYPFYNIAVSFGMTLVIGIVIGLVVPFDLIFASECRRHNFNSSSFPTKRLRKSFIPLIETSWNSRSSPRQNIRLRGQRRVLCGRNAQATWRHLHPANHRTRLGLASRYRT